MDHFSWHCCPHWSERDKVQQGGTPGNHTPNHLDTSGPQASMFPVPNPSTWFLSVSSPAPFNWFHFWGYALWTIGLLFQIALVSFLSLDLVADGCPVLQGFKKLMWVWLVSESFLAWVLAHPINLVLVLYSIFLLLCGYWLLKLTWCQHPVAPAKCDDPVPLS